MTMVESLASGKPVIALGRGGAMDIVGNGCGVLYAEPTEACLEDALRAFERVEPLIDPAQLKLRAAAFSEAMFERHFRAVVNRSRSGNVTQNARAAPLVTLEGGVSERVRPWIPHESQRGWHLSPVEHAE
jgi:hypothetical protein